jgi:molybdopterin-containing oxidoreductase family iron-sulfur binding subunit
MGRGHKEYGRFAKDVGVNPLAILDAVKDGTTGELALSATRVNVSKASFNNKERLVRFGGSESQVGRKLVASIKADVFNRTEGA